MINEKEDIGDYYLYFEGCCQKYPGPEGFGFAIYNGDEELLSKCYDQSSYSNYYMFASKNDRIMPIEYEYLALIKGLYCASQKNITHLKVYGSLLSVINDMNLVMKYYNCKLLSGSNDMNLVMKNCNCKYESNYRLKYLVNKCKELIENFEYITFTHVFLNHDKRARKLSEMEPT
jgi:ribonuclease HI